MHGCLSLIICDYEGFILSFLTHIPGRTHDSLAASYFSDIRKMIGKKYLLGDPGFQAVSNCVAGFKNAHLPKTPEHKKFDQVSRQEQIVIEHVNCWLKKSKTVDKETKFRHSRSKLILCVFIVCGLYNYKKQNKD